MTDHIDEGTATMTISLEAGLELLITDLLDSAELDLNAASATIELTAKNRLITRAGTQIDTAVRVRELLEASRPLPGDFEALSVSESNEKADTFHVAQQIEEIRRVANARTLSDDVVNGISVGELLDRAVEPVDIDQ